MTQREILAAQRANLGLSIPGVGTGAGRQHLTQETWAWMQSPGLGGKKVPLLPLLGNLGQVSVALHHTRSRC